MRVIAFASQKGGSGKTTLAGHVAVRAEQLGHGPVGLIDTDPQGSLADWWNARQAETPAFVHTYVSRLTSDLADLREAGMRLAVIDTPPAITSTIRHVIEACDLVVLPSRPSPHDLRAAGATLEITNQLGRPVIFVINAATPRARITAEAAIALSQHGTVAPVSIHHRTDFASSMIDGRTVMEANASSRSAQEIDALTVYVMDRLSQVQRRTIMPASQPVVASRGFGRRPLPSAQVLES